MKTSEVRERYIKFFEASPRDHKQIKPAPLVLPEDPTTLFTSAGMQPLVPYLLGEEHPKGKRLVNSQPSIRMQDIEEVGDNRHTTFFEMLGNWSLGDYFKDEQLAWFYEFLTSEIGLTKDRLWISVFEGGGQVPKDIESAEIWKKIGIKESRIGYYSAKKNWWSRNGTPSKMPIGDIGGPDSEVFYDFGEELKLHENSPYAKQKCHMNCDCGRFLEIGNSVFMQYKKVAEGKLEELPNMNVDFGGGLERITAASIDSPDVFEIDVMKDIIDGLEKITGKSYQEKKNIVPFRIISDHLRAATFLANDGVLPSNKQHGYILRRLIRRSAVKLRDMEGSIHENAFDKAIDKVFDSYEDHYLDLKNRQNVKKVLSDELKRFTNTLEKGLREIKKIDTIDARKAFDLYQSYGFPLEITAEIFSERGQAIDINRFQKEFEKHKEASRSTSAGVFKGGLADESEETIRFHTATHLLQAALRKVLGENVIQKGQNISGQRSRFDFNYPKKLTENELNKVESLINEIVEKNLPVKKKLMKRTEAERTGAIHAFGEKYGEEVSVYYVGKTLESAFSREFCGGPHVSRTSQVGRVKIKKQDKIGANTVRIYLVFDN
ncbi:alanine--tRNA ligase [Candidatus Woesebacteria bacterium]|nr:alanine--tRNA ligase [Candidatus Woesebacteria bacterium]